MPRYGDAGEQYFFSSTGKPAAGCELTFTDIDGNEIITYYDQFYTIPNPNPVILDAAGRQPDIWFPDTDYLVNGEPPVTPGTFCPLGTLDNTNLTIHGYFTEGTGNTTSNSSYDNEERTWTILDPNSWVQGPRDCAYGITMSADIRSCYTSSFTASLQGKPTTLMWWMKQRGSFVLSTAAAGYTEPGGGAANEFGNGGLYSGHLFMCDGVGGVFGFVTGVGDGAGGAYGNRRSWEPVGVGAYFTRSDIWVHVAISTGGANGNDPSKIYINGTKVWDRTDYATEGLAGYISGSGNYKFLATGGTEIRANTTWNVKDGLTDGWPTPTEYDYGAAAWGDFADFRWYSEVISDARILSIAQGLT